MNQKDSKDKGDFKDDEQVNNEDKYEKENGNDNKELTKTQLKRLKRKQNKVKGNDNDEETNTVVNDKSKSSNSQIEGEDAVGKQENTECEEAKIEIKHMNNTDSKTSSSTNDVGKEQQPINDFEKELLWCVTQVKLGLKNNCVTKDQGKLLLV